MRCPTRPSPSPASPTLTLTRTRSPAPAPNARPFPPWPSCTTRGSAHAARVPSPSVFEEAGAKVVVDEASLALLKVRG